MSSCEIKGFNDVSIFDRNYKAFCCFFYNWMKLKARTQQIDLKSQLPKKNPNPIT